MRCSKTNSTAKSDERIERFLPPDPAASAVAREFVTTALIGWGLPGLADDAALITAELFSNALRHAPSPQYVLAVDHNGGKPRIEMWDSGEHLPRKQDPEMDAETGRGLHLIEALATDWGTRHAASGKCVWATL
jgi:anti-sigma regulatory factor (Ser/Thr protein kinase)